jgi:hypothetical protein
MTANRHKDSLPARVSNPNRGAAWARIEQLLVLVELGACKLEPQAAAATDDGHDPLLGVIDGSQTAERLRSTSPSEIFRSNGGILQVA